MAIPTIFTQSGDRINAQYDWYDASTGSGMKRFYPCVMKTSAATVYFLSDRVIEADNSYDSPPLWYLQFNNTTAEVNFDITFNNPCVLSGEALINFTMSVDTAPTSTYAVFTFYRVVGGVETSIGTIQTSSINSGSDVNVRRLTKVPITLTTFGVGDTLRLEVKGVASGGAGNNEIYFDPSGRETLVEAGGLGNIDTSMTVDIPFRIDL